MIPRGASPRSSRAVRSLRAAVAVVQDVASGAFVLAGLSVAALFVAASYVLFVITDDARRELCD